MELKDVILSTLAEMEEVGSKQLVDFEVKETITPQINKKPNPQPKEEAQPVEAESILTTQAVESELVYLNSIRERLLVLFEGFQAPNNKNIEAKVDMTLNFLEYVLATIDTRVETLKKGRKE